MLKWFISEQSIFCSFIYVILFLSVYILHLMTFYFDKCTESEVINCP